MRPSKSDRVTRQGDGAPRPSDGSHRLSDGAPSQPDGVTHDDHNSFRMSHCYGFKSERDEIAFIHRAGFEAVVVVVYRPGCCGVTQTFYDDYSDMLERLSTFSAPLMIAGDFNIHVDDETEVHAGKLTDLLACHSLRQHVAYPPMLKVTHLI